MQGRDISGHRFGQLMVLKLVTGARRRTWLCQCECGSVKAVQQSNLLSSHTKSCGCLKHIGPVRHGHAHSDCKSREYISWTRMKSRCSNLSVKYYGANGVKVCERWKISFENFLADMGKCPDGMSIDRWPDKNGNYEPSNCRWATAIEQANNTSRNRFVVFDGLRLTVAQWASRYGLNPTVLLKRLNRKWPTEKALNKRSKTSLPLSLNPLPFPPTSRASRLPLRTA